MKAVDYSDRAISERIRQVSELRKLCLSLGKAKPVEDDRTNKTDRTDRTDR